MPYQETPTEDGESRKITVTGYVCARCGAYGGFFNPEEWMSAHRQACKPPENRK